MTALPYKPVFRLFLLCLLGISMAVQVHAQRILLDQPVRAGELTLFPDLKNEHEYYFLPDKARLAQGPDGNPQFSFLRYVSNQQGGSGTILQEGEGGGIVHALVELSVLPEQLREAERDLQRYDAEGVIKGPVIYRSGKFALVSSFADETGDLTEQILGIGDAPILDGQKAAISMQLTKFGAKLLWESFKTPTPDISFSFQMVLAGFRSPIEATLEANFDQIYQNKTFDAGVASVVFSAEVKAAFDDLRKSGAIKFTGVEADENMERLIEISYKKLADMMMEPANNTLSQMTALNTGQSSLDRATNLLQQARQETERENARIREDNRERRQEAQELAERRADRSPTGVGTAYYTQEAQQEKPVFSAAASFRMRKTKMKGTFKVSLNKYMADELSIRFDENIGQVDCEACFQQVNLEDMFFRQREIAAFIDGLNADDFGDYINFVTLQIIKEHEKGEVTRQELRITRENFNQKGNIFNLVYGVKEDTDINRWMNYQYQVAWNFFGDHEWVEGPLQTQFNAINLSPPYRRRIVEIEAEPDLLSEAGVRMVSVQIFYTLGDKELTTRETIRPSENIFSKKMAYIAPADTYAFDYEIIWRLNGGKTISTGRKTSAEPILFVDELPSVD